MKKAILTVTMILIFTGTVWAGPNFFSSDNEQYGLMANSYIQLALIYNMDANAAYTNYMLAAYSFDDATADEMYDLYEEAFDESMKAVDLAL